MILTYAQNNGSIAGQVKSSKADPLSFATVTVFKTADTSIVSYKLTDKDGKFQITSLPVGIDLTLLVSYTGHQSYREVFSLTTESPKKEFETISMTEDNDMLEEAIVSAERPPIVMRKDTIEFDAAAFKTLPTAMVEDLLKKLPGVQLTEDGQFMVNGRTVNRILVDGKEFFGSNVQTTTRNLPAFTISKVAVYDDPRDLMDDPYKPKHQIGQVVNLKLKKEYRKGLFGRAYAGGGTDDRYEIGGIVNMFRDTTQISLLGYSNNLSKSSFSASDMMNLGGMNRSPIRSISVNSGGGIAFNGISTGGMNSGIEQVAGGGINLNHVFKNNLSVSTQYFYNRADNLLDTRSRTDQFIVDTVLTTNANSSVKSVTNTHVLNVSTFWKIDSVTTMRFDPSLNLTNGRTMRPGYSEMIKNETEELNNSTLDGKTFNDRLNYEHQFHVSRNLNKKWLISVANVVRMDNTDQQLIDNVLNFYFPGDVLNQNRQQNQDRVQQSIDNSINLTHYISSKWSVNYRYRYQYEKQKNGIYTYDALNPNDVYDIFIPSLSDDFGRRVNEHNGNISIIYRTADWRISPTLRYVDLGMQNEFITLGNKRNYNFNYLLPSLNLEYKRFSFSISRNVNLPELTTMQPVANANNPLRIIIGNPDLKPEESTSFSIAVRNFGKPDQYYNLSANANIYENAVVESRTVDPKGVQTIEFVQVGGRRSAQLNGDYNKTWKNTTDQKFSFGVNSFININENPSFLNGEKISSEVYSYRVGSRVGLIHKNSLEVNLNFSITYIDNKFKNQNVQDFDYNLKSFGANITYRPIPKIVLNSKYDLTYNQLIADGFQKYVQLWNLSGTYQFGKNMSKQITLSVFDVLNDNVSVRRTVMSNYISDVQSRIQQQYFLLTFSMNINNFTPKQSGFRIFGL